MRTRRDEARRVRYEARASPRITSGTGASTSGCRLADRRRHLPFGLALLAADLLPDPDVPALTDPETTDHDRHEGDRDRVEQPGREVAGGRQQRGREQREVAAGA